MAAVLTYVKGAENVYGNQRSVSWLAALDNSYPANGYAVTARKLGLSAVRGVNFSGPQATFHFRYDPTTALLKAFVGATAVEVASGVDVSAVTALPLTAIGS